ncbi:hypothetical protein FA95DRAFT_1613167 [Auriscalpium vulgare]|uniref:Uncharacterized protein n=1 Tax=Auriscalpium vulgare TaxID=40419 RepID=A0ACB8R3U9_9AGAM|nr:hypothetical protein FA95DRAFT_1613167 [Auriscalpium vulgare]
MTHLPGEAAVPLAAGVDAPRLPGYTETFVPGKYVYYVLVDMRYRGIYTDWTVIGPVARQRAIKDHDLAMAILANDMANMAVSSAVSEGSQQQATEHGDNAPPSPALAEPAPIVVPDDGSDQSDGHSSDSEANNEDVPGEDELTELIPTEAEIAEGYAEERGSRPGGGWPYLAVARGRRRGIFLNGRKVSKAEKQLAENLRKVARHYELPASQIACTTKDEDPLRTPLMRKLEDKIWSDWTAHREELTKVYPDDRLARYIANIRNAIQEQLDEVRAPLLAGDNEKIHKYRRFIAGLHQEIDVMQHGEKVYDATLYDQAFVFAGRSVRRAYFKRIYGF